MSAIVAAARALLGTPFRLHGRNPDGLDCVGLATAACEAGGFSGAVPDGYALRSGDGAAVAAAIAALGLEPLSAPAPGALLLFASGPGQLHLAIATESGIVHADAGLRRVVERPGPAPWPLLAAWRIGKD